MKKKKKLAVLSFMLCIITIFIVVMTACPPDVIGGGDDDDSSSSSSLASSTSSEDSSASSVGDIVYQAEDQTWGSGVTLHASGTYLENMNQPGAWNQINDVDGGTGGFAGLRITYATEGVYPACRKSLIVNGTEVKHLIFQHSGNWATFVDFDVTGDIYLNASTTNTIKILNDDANNDWDGLNIDKYTIILNQIPVSDNTTDYQAEDGVWGNGAVISASGNAIENFDNLNKFTEIHYVNGGTGGEKHIIITYDSDAGPRTKSLYINNNYVKKASFPSSGGWGTYTTLDVTADLSADFVNIIKLQHEAADSGGINVDKYTVILNE